MARFFLFQSRVLLTCGLLSLTFSLQAATAAPLSLSWVDNSDNEENFQIERSPEKGSTFVRVATVGANITAYTDGSVTEGLTYCYRVRAANAAGNSGYTNIACARASTTAAQLRLSWADNSTDEEAFKIERISDDGETFFPLTAVKANTTSYVDGDVTEGSTYCYRVRAANLFGNSIYTNIACGKARPNSPTFSISLREPSPHTTVSGSTTKISALVTGNVEAVTVRFILDGRSLGKPIAIPPYELTWDTTTTPDGSHQLVAKASTVNSVSASAPVKITVDNSGTNPPPPTPEIYTLTVVNTGTGSGEVTSTPAGIICGDTCLTSYDSETTVVLTALPMKGSLFRGWSGDCVGADSCTVSMTGARAVTATFVPQLLTKIGIFRPQTGEWYLDVNGNGEPDDCAEGGCIQSFGQKKGLPVVGDWLGTGNALLGVFDPKARLWKLDRNGDDRWENCAIDICIGPIFQSQDVPLVGHWMPGAVNDRIGVYRPHYPDWRVDANGNGRWDGCKKDGCRSFGKLKGIPVVGDWTGSGTTQIGIFEQATGQWKLDSNGNGKWDGCAEDNCLTFPSLSAEDHPITGDWTGTGQDRIGVFDSTTGSWRLDLNGNGEFDGCTIDACLGPFGQPGDLPVVGKW